MQHLDWPSCECKLLFCSALIISRLAALAVTSSRPAAKHPFSIINELFIPLPGKSLHWLTVTKIINLLLETLQTVSRFRRHISEFWLVFLMN